MTEKRPRGASRAREQRGRAARRAAAARARGHRHRLAPRRAPAQLLPDRPRHRRAGDDHDLLHLVAHQRRRRVDQAVRAAHLRPEHLSAVRGTGHRPAVCDPLPDHDRRARRQPARAHLHQLRRADARAHADRAQRLPRPEADLRVGHLRHGPSPSFQKVGPHRVPVEGHLEPRVRHGRDLRRDQRSTTPAGRASCSPCSCRPASCRRPVSSASCRART